MVLRYNFIRQNASKILFFVSDFPNNNNNINKHPFFTIFVPGFCLKPFQLFKSNKGNSLTWKDRIKFNSRCDSLTNKQSLCFSMSTTSHY